MNQIPGLGKNFVKLPTILSTYEKELQSVEDRLSISGKTIEKASKENATWQYYFDGRRAEMYTLVKFFEGQVQKTRGKLFKKYKENYSVALSERDITKYIDSDEEYITSFEIFLEVKEVYDKFQAVVDAFQTRGYALNNIVKARVADVHQYMIE